MRRIVGIVRVSRGGGLVVALVALLYLSQCSTKRQVSHALVEKDSLQVVTSEQSEIRGRVWQEQADSIVEEIALQWWGGGIVDSVRRVVPEGGIVMRRQWSLSRQKTTLDTLQRTAVREGTINLHREAQSEECAEVVEPRPGRDGSLLFSIVLFIVVTGFILWRYYSK